MLYGRLPNQPAARLAGVQYAQILAAENRPERLVLRDCWQEKGRPKRVGWKMFKNLTRENAAALWFCCQIATLGLLRQLVSYSPAAAAIESYPFVLLWLARILSVVTLATFAFLVGRPRARALAFDPRALAGATVALVAGAALALYGASSELGYALSQVLIGVSHAWILAAWACWLAGLPADGRTWAIGVSGLLAVLLFSLAGWLPLALRGPAFLLMVAGSALPVVLKFGAARSRNEEGAPVVVPAGSLSPAASVRSALASLPTELIVLMASYAMLFRLLTILEFPVPEEALRCCTSALRIGGMALLVLYLARQRFNPNMRQVLVPLMALTVMGLVLLPVPSGGFAVVSVAMVEASWTFFYVLIWLVLFEVGRESKGGELLVFLCGWTIMNAILVAAAPVASLLETQISEGALSLTALALVLVYMFSVALLLMRRSKRLVVEVRPTEPSADWQEGQATFYREVADRHGLTPRETEVFELLVQGYSLPAIEEQFVLSHSTVKGHARNIYRKFNVASKQELIASVDELRRNEASPIRR
ncbi:LuxR family transcriptional regulator [uncultured Adlercreutzia sp.]|uniref:helix-turn-helix transcriptional regulator n=1 Tax=uncultured Adlercreutzia sp. TaxID=875803 RepID=UPI0025E40A26|nr:LuxR family transcriptional regulator [uncultured Adlercreutzia sp.]